MSPGREEKTKGEEKVESSSIQVMYLVEHKTFALAINRDYFSTVFTSDHPCTI